MLAGALGRLLSILLPIFKFFPFSSNFQVFVTNIQPAFTYSKETMKHQNIVWNLFKVDNKDTDWTDFIYQSVKQILPITIEFCYAVSKIKKTKNLWNQADWIYLNISTYLEQQNIKRGGTYFRSSHERCSLKKDSQESTCARVSFLIKMQPWGLQLY